ncbi:MAG: hypothetical protein ACT4PY_06780 [Armatimonadota bacterium]
MRGARRLLALSGTAWRWFGPRVTMRFLLLSWVSLTRRRALAAIYDRLGRVSFRRPFRGKKLHWARVDFGFIKEIFERRSYTAIPEMEIGEGFSVLPGPAGLDPSIIYAVRDS